MDRQCHNLDTETSNAWRWRTFPSEELNGVIGLHSVPAPDDAQDQRTPLRRLTILFSDLPARRWTASTM